MAALLAGALVGFSLLHVFGSLALCILGFAVYLSLLPTHSLRGLVGVTLSYLVGLGGTSGFWVGEAFYELGAGPLESVTGMVVTILWSGAPHIVPITLTLAACRPRSDLFQIAWVAAVVFISESVLLRIPGSVPWTLLGYSAADFPGLAQLASIGGVPLVSAAIASGSQLLVLLGRPDEQMHPSRAAMAWGASLAATTFFALPIALQQERGRSSTAPTIRFLAIQPNLPRSERIIPRRSIQEFNGRRQSDLSERALSESPSNVETTVVWPENAISIASTDDPMATMGPWIKDLRTRGILGYSRGFDVAQPHRITSSIVSLDREGKVEGFVDKAIAVPIVEASPENQLGRFVADLLGDAGRGPRVVTSPVIKPLSSSSRAVVLLCFEALFPRAAESRRPPRATAILNLADDSWIKSPYPSRQLIAILRFRAIEQRLPAIRVAHGGQSASIDPFGRIVDSLPRDQSGWLSVEASPSLPPSRLFGIYLAAVGIVSGVGSYWLIPRLARVVNAFKSLVASRKE